MAPVLVARASSPSQSEYFLDEEAAAAEAAADERAEDQFKTIMQQNVINAPVMAMPRSPPPVQVTEAPAGATAEVPLDQYGDVRDRLAVERERQAEPESPPVVLGAARYEGEARPGSLALRMTMQVTLGGPGHWKTVPLVGDTVVVVSARRDGRALPLSTQNGYHVWVTREGGEATLDLELLVPSHSPRGSIEYDFLVAHTPVTTLGVTFPVAGLQPRLRAAVRSEVTSSTSSTRLDATLRPTARVHMVGFRDLGGEGEREAKIYAESLNLLSLDEGTLELFTVVRYSILYAGTKSFRISIPADLEVVSAEGEGAFRWALEAGPSPGDRVLAGETAFPIRNNYEVSLRLRRQLDKAGQSFDVVRPHPLGVEREYGWLGIEVTGKLKLDEESATGVIPVDVRQLPADMLESAVRPILRAYRYHAAEARLRLDVERLPEIEPASGSVDSVQAHTAMVVDGRSRTQMRITLRNRLRHHLTLKLPSGSEVRSALLDGQPIKPSRDAAGDLMLPLKRSAGGERPDPFSLLVILENDEGAVGLAGRSELALPALDLPVSSLAWSLYLPARNLYRRPQGDIEAQTYWGTGEWQQPVMQVALPSDGGDDTDADDEEPADLGDLLGGTVVGPLSDGGESGGVTGAMPVRMQIPKSGQRLEYQRYWLEAGQPAEVSVWYVRRWLRIPAALLLAALFAAALGHAVAVVVPGRPPTFPGGWRFGLAGAVVLAWPVWVAGGAVALTAAVVTAALLVLFSGGRYALATGALQRRFGEARAEWTRHREREREAKTRTRAWVVLWRLAVGAGLGIAALALVILVAQLLALMASPLP